MLTGSVRPQDRTTYVQEVIHGFAAHKSGQFQVRASSVLNVVPALGNANVNAVCCPQEHDIVVAVDQEPIEGWNLDAIKQLTVRENLDPAPPMRSGAHDGAKRR
eukprot:2464849-Rhodomonas_salina.3